MLVQGIANDELALGFLPLAYVEQNKSRLKIVPVDDGKAENGDGPISPSAQTVRDGTYQPLSRPLFIYVSRKAADRPEVQRFVDSYFTSADAHSRGRLRRADAADLRAGEEALRRSQGRHGVRRRRLPGRHDARSAARPGAMKRFEFLIEWALFLCALLSIGTTVGIIVVLAVETFAFFREVSIVEFLFGTEWTPLFANPRFGVLPLVVGTTLVSLDRDDRGACRWGC